MTRTHKPSQRNFVRRAAAKRERATQKEQATQASLKRDEDLRKALAKPAPSLAASVKEALRISAGYYRTHSPNEESFCFAVAKKSPRVWGYAKISALRELARAQWIRSISEWEPRGKGRETQYRSLCEHLLAKYPMPSFLWSVFSEEGEEGFIPFACLVAQGESVYKTVKDGWLPVPMTRQMCHDLMTSRKGSTLTEAVRMVQVKSFGGSDRLFRAWIKTHPGRRLHDPKEEAFWQTVLAWFSRFQMLDSAQVGPLTDYIQYRRNQNAEFTMKGRSPLALIRDMEAWHKELGQAKAHGKFQPSGFQEADFDHSRKDEPEIWHVREILSHAALRDEGRAMGHCVYSYASRIEKKEVSIWSITWEELTGHWRALTVEVNNQYRAIVQVRGRFNRLPLPREQAVLRQWATKNALELKV